MFPELVIRLGQNMQPDRMPLPVCDTTESARKRPLSSLYSHEHFLSLRALDKPLIDNGNGRKDTLGPNMVHNEIAHLSHLEKTFKVYQGLDLVAKIKSERTAKDLLDFDLNLNILTLEIQLRTKLGLDNKATISDLLNLIKSGPTSNISDPLIKSIHYYLNNSDDLLFDNREYLFISGVGRSGTTALGNAFTFCVQNTILFIERYNWHNGYCPLSFEPGYVFMKDDVYMRNPAVFDKIKPVVNNLMNQPFCYVGDKRPNFIYSLDITRELFMMARKTLNVVHVFRDPLDVAPSWQKRATDVNDRWPAHRDYILMEKDYKCQTRLALNASNNQSPGMNFILCNYNSIFADPHVLYNLFKLVAPESRINYERCVQVVKHSSNFLNKPKEIDNTISTFYKTNTDASICFNMLKASSSV